MKNIILLGYKGTIGRRLYRDINNLHNIFTDENLNIKKLIDKKFIIKHKIDFIINCIGVKNKKDLFFNSNYFVPAYISKKLSEIDPFLKKKILYIQISSIGVNNPFETYNLKNIKLEIIKKQKINYNLYEFSKAAGDYIVINNMENLENIKYSIIKPSNIIETKSNFILKLKIFLIIFPFRIPKYRTIPVTTISNISEYIIFLFNKKIPVSNKSKKIYIRFNLTEITKEFDFLMLIKPVISVKIMSHIIKLIPNFSFFRSLKRILILLYLL